MAGNAQGEVAKKAVLTISDKHTREFLATLRKYIDKCNKAYEPIHYYRSEDEKLDVSVIPPTKTPSLVPTKKNEMKKEIAKRLWEVQFSYGIIFDLLNWGYGETLAATKQWENPFHEKVRECEKKAKKCKELRKWYEEHVRCVELEMKNRSKMSDELAKWIYRPEHGD